LGGHHWKRFDPSSYQQLIHQALTKKISWLEVAGQEGGDIAMVGAIQSSIEKSPQFLESPLTITTRIGYRSLKPSTEELKGPDLLPGDVMVTEDGSQQDNVAHNVSSEYILESLQSSCLLELQEMKKLKLVFLIQNPEVQVLEFLKENPRATVQDRQAYIQQKWEPALETLQEYATASNHLISFGVVSNGLGIPEENDHPMYLDSNLVIDAAKKYDRFSTVQLPANLLETQGWEMARKIHAAAPSVTVAAMRPLTCYPDLGTGTGYPFRLVDYALPSLQDNPFGPFSDDSNIVAPGENVQYTNEIAGIPAIYQIALQTAMSHFDAEEILEAKQTRDLTMEERETLDGCKLVQSMIHDLDTDLEHIRSFAAHEDELYGRIIPLLYGTFEAMDDSTSDVLQAYFAAYAVAVRYAIAKKTRQILKEGEGSGVAYPDIPQSMTLQEYALRHMMADNSLTRIVIGASTLQDFEHQAELIEKVSTADSPLDAINTATELEHRKKKEEAEIDD
jgi:hypothetical protein